MAQVDSEHTIQGKLAKDGKQQSSVVLDELAAQFRAFYAEHGTDFINFERPVWGRYIDLVSTLMFDDHFIKLNAESDNWEAEQVSGKGLS